MAGTHGTQELQKLLNVVAEGLNVASKIKHKQGIFVAFQMSDELMALGTLDMEALKKEAGELDQKDRDEMIAGFKKKLDLQNKEVEKKIESGVDIIDEAIEIGKEAVALVEKFKALV